MNVQYLKENKLLEEYKQFLRLCEISYTPSSLTEDGEDEPQEDPNAMGGGADGMPPMGDEDPNAMGGGSDGMPPMGDEGPNAMGGGADGMPPMGGGADGMPPMGGDDDMPPMDGEEDDVIDVDDITNAQEKMNDKVNVVGKDLAKVDDKLSTLNGTIDKLLSMIDRQNGEIESLKKEFERRNPTQTEKLNLRSLDSYPFNVSPNDYWKAKGIDSNYEIRSDNSEPTNSEESLTITNSDVDDFNDREIEGSLSFIDDDWKQSLQKIFGF